jgi:proteasome lid subunit RPN8/RPN11
MSVLSENVVSEASLHALREYPKESVGYVIDDTYYPVKNVSKNPTQSFKVANKDVIAAKKKGSVIAWIHSHPVVIGEEPQYSPSADDMRAQIANNVPYAIIVCDGENTSKPIIWGDTLPIAPLIGRSFLHGVSDCYSLIRDIFRVGKEECAKQGIDWPYDKIELPEIPRDDDWWKNSQDLYIENFAKAGFKPVQISDIKSGDVFLIKIKSTVINHGGVLIGNDQILHHLPHRPSGRDNAGLWAGAADLWLRYHG